MTLSEKRGIEKWATLFFTAVLLLFLGYLLVRYRSFTYILRENLFTTPFFWTEAAIYAVLAALGVLLYRELARLPVWACAVLIFGIACVARFLACVDIVYYPQSDMTGYYKMGVAFAEGDYAFITKTANDYQIPDFIGLGVLYGWIAKLVSTDVHSFQTVFSLVTAGSCVLIYLIATRLQREAAPISGLLMALYPANIIFSQVLTNQHLNVLFALLAVYLLLCAVHAEKLWHAALLGLGSGFSLLLAQYAHPSTATTVVAVGLYLAVLLVAGLKNKSRWLPVAAVACAFALGLCGGRVLANAYFDSYGLRDGLMEEPTCYLSKIVVGLNYETEGMYSYEDYGRIATEPAEGRNALCMGIIRERLSDTRLFRLLDHKVRCLWMFQDTAFGWSIFGMQDEIATEQEDNIESETLGVLYNRHNQFLKALNLLDFFYVAVLYLFAFLGLLLLRTKNNSEILLTLVPLGWIAVHLFSEIQTRYRYFAMPYFCIFAGIGVLWLCKRIVGWVTRRARA